MRGHLVRKTDFPLPSSSPLPSPSTSLQTTKVVLGCSGFFPGASGSGRLAGGNVALTGSGWLSPCCWTCSKTTAPH